MSDILLSFDIEEFDLPLEYGLPIDEKTQMETSRVGLETILSLLNKLNIKATFFITARFALQYPELVVRLSLDHEVASHSFFHSNFNQNHLEESKIVLEKLINRKVNGIRLPRLRHIESVDIQKAGYNYNASLNPTFIPGRYNNFGKKRLPFWENKILILPVSVTPLLRIPLFWLSFKILPMPFIKFISKLTIKKDSYLSLYFHSWEFADISSFPLPYYLKKANGISKLRPLESYLIYLKKFGKFMTHEQFNNNYKN